MARRGDQSHKILFQALLPALRRLEPGLGARVVLGMGRFRYAIRPDVRRRVQAAVERCNAHFDASWDVAGVSRDLVANQILWHVRDRLFDGHDDDPISRLFEVSGRDRLDSAASAGRGVVVLCNHFGAHMHPAHWLTRQGYPLRLFMERPRTISDYLSRGFNDDSAGGQGKLFISRRATPAESASSILRACRSLRSGALLYIAGDVRWSGQLSTRARFLGRDFSLSTTWVTLAALSGSPVVPVFCTPRPDGTYALEFLESFVVPSHDQQPDRAEPWVRRYIDALEDHVRRHPENSNDYFFWGEAESAAA